MDDPIVEEVHRVRQELMERFNYDLKAFLQYLKEQEEEERKNGRVIVSIRPKRIGSATQE